MTNTIITKCGQSAGKKGNKEAWTKPVSRKFYEKLTAKVVKIVADLGYVRGYTEIIMQYIDLYIDRGELPRRSYCEEYIMTLFYTLRCEIDEAAKRSAEARRRAAERKARKDAAVQQTMEVADSEENDATGSADKQAMVTPKIRGKDMSSVPDAKYGVRRSAVHGSDCRKYGLRVNGRNAFG